MILIADTIDLKIEAMHMHGVIGIARINPAPVNGFANLEGSVVQYPARISR